MIIDEVDWNARENISVVHREPPYTAKDYDDAIEALVAAKTQAISMAAGEGQAFCRVCEDNGHTAEQCHHNPLRLAHIGTIAIQGPWYLCYHCGETMHSFEAAEEHFGEDPSDEAYCQRRWWRRLKARVTRLFAPDTPFAPEA